jgi:hypothetical protein
MIAGPTWRDQGTRRLEKGFSRPGPNRAGYQLIELTDRGPPARAGNLNKFLTTSPTPRRHSRAALFSIPDE